MEELHNHLYLKSPYCDSRWATYTTGQEARKVYFFFFCIIRSLFQCVAYLSGRSFLTNIIVPTTERGMFEGLVGDKFYEPEEKKKNETAY